MSSSEATGRGQEEHLREESEKEGRQEEEMETKGWQRKIQRERGLRGRRWLVLHDLTNWWVNSTSPACAVAVASSSCLGL